MLRLLLVVLIIRCAAATSEDTEGTASGVEDHMDDELDVEEEMIPDKTRHLPVDNAALDKSQGGEEETSTDGTMVIIIAAASVVALAIVAVGGIILFRRYLRSQEQGVYSMPAERGQKAAV